MILIAVVIAMLAIFTADDDLKCVPTPRRFFYTFAFAWTVFRGIYFVLEVLFQ